MKTDKEGKLDKIFKEGLETPAWNTNFREDDWDAMEALLDKGKKRKGIVFWLPVLGSIAAMLVVALAWFLMKHDNSPTVATQSVKQPIHSSAPVNSGSDTISNPTNPAQQLNASVKPGSVDTVSNPAKNKTITGVPSQKRQQLALVKADTVSNKFVLSSSANHNNKRVVKTAVSGMAATQLANNQQIKRTGKNATQQQDGINSISVINSTDVIAANNAALNVGDINSELSVNRIPKGKPQIVSASQKDSKTVKRINPNGPQYAITVWASPDINGVSSFQNAQVGENVGLLFSVGLGKRFTVSTGAAYSKKPYLTNFADYHTTYAFKTNPENVSADCRVLDIPINVDYMIYNRSRNKFSVGSGLSSYIMLRENYHYNYEYPGTVGPTDYDIANKNKHFLGVLNLDATYTRRLNSKFSVDVQPYLKVPLTNIGYSQVKLQSTGLAVGVTWNINSPPK